MKEYTVTWEIQLHATSPKAAAYEALRIQRDPNSLATFFEVSDGDATTGIDIKTQDRKVAN